MFETSEVKIVYTLLFPNGVTHVAIYAEGVVYLPCVDIISGENLYDL